MRMAVAESWCVQHAALLAFVLSVKAHCKNKPEMAAISGFVCALLIGSRDLPVEVGFLLIAVREIQKARFGEMRADQVRADR